MKLFEQVTTHRSLEPGKGYISMTSNHHGTIWAEGKTIDDAMKNLIAKVKQMRTPPTDYQESGRQHGPRNPQEWLVSMGDWLD